jgi:hypothetical protein
MAEPTISDVLDYIREKKITIELLGTTKKFINGFSDFCIKIGDAIAEEQGVPKKQILGLPLDTKLGEKSQIKFLELQKWFLKNK